MAGLDQAARTFIDADTAIGDQPDGALHAFDEKVEGLSQLGQLISASGRQALGKVALTGSDVLHGDHHAQQRL